MFSQIKNNNFIKILLILLILIISIAFLYKPHFKSKFWGVDEREFYRETKERNTLKNIIDYKFYSGKPDSESHFDPAQILLYNPGQLLIWRYMINHYDKNTYPYHMLCTLIHIMNAIIVFFLFKKLIRNNFFSFGAALSFAVYYPNFKTVGWIAGGLTTELATFFILSTVFLAIKYFQTKNIFLYFLSLLTFFLGIFTKEYVIFAIPMIFAYYLITQRKRTLKLIKTDLTILPYLLLSLPFILIVLSMLKSSALINTWGGFDFGIHMLYRFLDQTGYLITVVPVSFPIQIIVVMSILLSFPLLVYYGLKNKNLLFFIAWLALSISIYIFSNFRNIYALSRHLYLPSIVFFGLLYYLVANIRKNKVKIITSFFLINYTIIFNLFLILTKK